MTGQRPDVELLADLDADVLDPVQARHVRAAAAGDPAAAAVLAALAATRAQLATQPPLTVPPEVAARWTARLTPDGGGAADLETARQHGRYRHRPIRRRPGRAGRAVAAAALVAVLAGVLPTRPDPPGPDVVRLTRIDLATVGTSAIGVLDLGELADTRRRAACLQAVGTPTAAAVLGGRRVLMDGAPGTLLVLGTGVLGRFRIVVVSPSCGTLLAEATVGR